MATAEKGTCFVICPIDEQGTTIRDRADNVFEYVIAPAAQNCGYEAVRSDRGGSPGLITVQIVQHLQEAPMVVADLTGQNPNVFFELAVRMMTLKPFVLMAEEGEIIPFDVTGLRLISLDSRNLKSADQCGKDLEEQIRFAEDHSQEITTPVSIVRDRQAVAASETALPVATRAVNVILSQLEAIRSELKRAFPPKAELLDSGDFRDLVKRANALLHESPDAVATERKRAGKWGRRRAYIRATKDSSGEESEPSVEE